MAEHPKIVALADGGYPFVDLPAAHDFAAKLARISGSRQRVALRRIWAPIPAGYRHRRWVVTNA